MEEITFFWLRRDFRLNDNTGLNSALRNNSNVQLVFIYDTSILDELPKDDARVTFIWQYLEKLNKELNAYGSSVLVKHGNPIEVWKELLSEFNIANLYTNRDYEPRAIARDKKVRFLMETNGVNYLDFKDHVFFEKAEVLKADGTPYTIYTPYKNKWLEKYARTNIEIPKKEEQLNACYSKSNFEIPSLKSIGFIENKQQSFDYDLKGVDNYDQHRDYPFIDKTTRLGHHLRFGTISIRSLVAFSTSKNSTFLSELIWRDFFSQILAHFPHVLEGPFKKKYANIEWRNNEKEFQLWCEGKTGYPIVDAGMRQLNATGFMHNRVRMVVASFLIKHLLIDWRWGEAYFAEKLLDFDLASNNGNWQWAAGTGCDSAPYFRVFNPTLQQEKFDKQRSYIQHWIPDFNSENYLKPIVEHKMARVRAIDTYKTALEQYEA
ncbi:MAG: deoxyribodipyrimidine photo-lyase [Crocinitomix sp.]|nr:deoxyribodipyrimidine photo-lyase [Crocinitomix sp.]